MKNSTSAFLAWCSEPAASVKVLFRSLAALIEETEPFTTAGKSLNAMPGVRG